MCMIYFTFNMLVRLLSIIQPSEQYYGATYYSSWHKACGILLRMNELVRIIQSTILQLTSLDAGVSNTAVMFKLCFIVHFKNEQFNWFRETEERLSNVNENNSHQKRSTDQTGIVEFLLHMYAVSCRYWNSVRVMRGEGSMKWYILVKKKTTDIYKV